MKEGKNKTKCVYGNKETSSASHTRTHSLSRILLTFSILLALIFRLCYYTYTYLCEVVACIMLPSQNQIPFVSSAVWYMSLLIHCLPLFTSIYSFIVTQRVFERAFFCLCICVQHIHYVNIWSKFLCSALIFFFIFFSIFCLSYSKW